MQKQQDDLLLARLHAAFPRMTEKDKVALVRFAEDSALENPKKIPDLTLVVTRRGVA